MLLFFHTCSFLFFGFQTLYAYIFDLVSTRVRFTFYCGQWKFFLLLFKSRKNNAKITTEQLQPSNKKTQANILQIFELYTNGLNIFINTCFCSCSGMSRRMVAIDVDVYVNCVWSWFYGFAFCTCCNALEYCLSWPNKNMKCDRAKETTRTTRNGRISGKNDNNLIIICNKRKKKSTKPKRSTKKVRSDGARKEQKQLWNYAHTQRTFRNIWKEKHIRSKHTCERQQQQQGEKYVY